MLDNSKKKIVKFTFLILQILILLSILSHCSPSISNFSPESGVVGTTVTINGNGFAPMPEQNVVKFGSVQATDVMVIQNNTIIAKVPEGAVTGLISIETSGGRTTSKTNFKVVQTKWTFMVYMDADNNLEPDGISDFLEMSSVGSSEDIKIVVQMDRIDGYSAAYDDWTDTRRFLIHKNDTPGSTPVQILGEVNMGNQSVLQEFVEWGINNYPAQHYALVIWNHGGGWRQQNEKRLALAANLNAGTDADVGIARAVAFDDTSDSDSLYVREVQLALQNAKSYNGTAFRGALLGFDACLMQMIEVSYAVRSVFDYMVGSEDSEPLAGWPYNTILSKLAANPALSPEDFAALIVKSYYSSFPYGSGITMSALDLSSLNTLAIKIDAFASKAITEWANLKTARLQSLTYHSGGRSYWGVDLWDFADKVIANVNSEAIKTAAAEIKAAIDALVISERHSTDSAGSHGIAIYFPESAIRFNSDPDHTGYDQNNSYMPIDFVTMHNWDEWLQSFYANNS